MDAMINALLEIISFVIQVLMLIIVCILYVCFKKEKR